MIGGLRVANHLRPAAKERKWPRTKPHPQPVELITCGLGGHVTTRRTTRHLPRLRRTAKEVWRCFCVAAISRSVGRRGVVLLRMAPLIMRGKAPRQAIIIRALGA